MKTRKKNLEERKVVFDTAPELYNKLLNIYKIQYDKLRKSRKKRIKVQKVLKKLPIDLYLDESEHNLPSMHELEGDAEVKLEPAETIAERIKLKQEQEQKKNTGTELKILAPNKSLTRVPLFLAEIKAAKNSYKLKDEIRQILYLLYKHNKITQKVYNNLIKSF